MELHGLMLANYAEVDQGLLNVRGGGWEYATVTHVPIVLQPFVAGHIVLAPDSTLDSVALGVALETPSGTRVEIADGVLPLKRTAPAEGEVWLEPLAFPLPLPVSEAGRHAALISAEGATVRIPLFVRVVPET